VLCEHFVAPEQECRNQACGDPMHAKKGSYLPGGPSTGKARARKSRSSAGRVGPIETDAPLVVDAD
jgi:hypothetical protein